MVKCDRAICRNDEREGLRGNEEVEKARWSEKKLEKFAELGYLVQWRREKMGCVMIWEHVRNCTIGKRYWW